MTDLLWKAKLFSEITTDELYQILKARCDVFVVEQKCPYPDMDNLDQKAIHLWAENKNEVLAYCRIFPKGIKYSESSIGRVLTTTNGRGKGVGRQMIHYAVQIVENRFKSPEIRISAQDYLIPFYKEFGFQETEKKYLEDNLPHTEMFRNHR